MNPQQAENLRILIRHMENNVTRTLDMVHVETCGAPACALGEACMVPELQAQGLGLYRAPYRFVEEIFGLVDPFVIPHPSRRQLPTHVFRLFGADLHGERHVTPQEWAKEARKVLQENGYSMDDDPKAAQFIAGIKRLSDKTIASLAASVCWPD